MKFIQQNQQEKICIRIIDDVDSIKQQIISIAKKKKFPLIDDNSGFDIVILCSGDDVDKMLSWLNDLIQNYEEKGFDDVIEWTIR